MTPTPRRAAALALVLALLARPARAASLEQDLLAQAPRLITHLQDKGCKPEMGPDRVPDSHGASATDRCERNQLRSPKTIPEHQPDNVQHIADRDQALIDIIRLREEGMAMMLGVKRGLKGYI